MNNIKLLSIGKIKNQHILSMVREYDKRLSRDVRIDHIILKDSDQKNECEKILQHIKGSPGQMIALSEDGVGFSSRDLAKYLQETGGVVTFIIGGPNGLNDRVKHKVNRILSLSKMTLTHELAQLILMEQIYRAYSILKGNKYHRD